VLGRHGLTVFDSRLGVPRNFVSVGKSWHPIRGICNKVGLVWDSDLNGACELVFVGLGCGPGVTLLSGGRLGLACFGKGVATSSRTSGTESKY